MDGHLLHAGEECSIPGGELVWIGGVAGEGEGEIVRREVEVVAEGEFKEG